MWFHLSFLGDLNWSYVFDILFLANPNGLILLLYDFESSERKITMLFTSKREFLLQQG